jgi:hypothetical protein
MPVSVKRMTLWRRDLENTPGSLATILDPVAAAGTDLQVAMGYRIPGQERRAVIELAPVVGRRASAAAEEAGLRPSDIPTLVVEGDDRPGLGRDLAAEMGRAGINMAFLVALVVGRRYAGVFGFESEEDAKKAAAIIKRSSGRPPRARAKGVRPRVGGRAATGLVRSR